MPKQNETPQQPLNATSIFSELAPDHQQQIVTQATHLSIKAGEALINQGEEADTLFFLLQGRLIVFSGEKPIAEILPGEPIGEIAFFTGGTRTATVVASRSCKLLQLNQQAYKSLIKDIPELTQSIIHALANRVTGNNVASPKLEPKISSVVALLPAGGCIIPDAFIEQLLGVQNALNTPWKALYATELENVEQLDRWIQDNEAPSGQLILVASGAAEQSGMALAMAEHADKSFLILNTAPDNPALVSALEEAVYENTLLNNVDLVLLRKDNSIQISGTAKVLEGRNIHLHHHVALNHQPDIERLQRFIAGKATGLVFCGGGAFGAAHLGMVKSLQEQGYVFDIIGGTSIGSGIAAIYALGLGPDKALAQMEEMFINKKALGKYSIPFYSIIDHRHLDNELKAATLDIAVEDLPINYFSVATSLTRNQIHINRKGPLWQAVRSSCSLPGILPPFITDDGEVLVDGALMDNTPIKTLRSLKPGPNVVMNFTPLKAWKIHSDYEEIPGGWALLKQMLLPKRKPRKYYPTIFAILSRTMITNTEQRFAEIDQKDDVFLEPQRLRRMGMLSWKKLRAQFELSYQQMNTALVDTGADTEQDKMQALRAAAHHMNRRQKPTN